MNRVDLTQANNLVVGAIMHLSNNNPLAKLPVRGGLMAVKSPSFSQIKGEVNPFMNPDPTRVTWDDSGTRPIPKVKVSVKPVNTKAVQSTRTARTAGSGVKPTAGVDFTTAFDMYFEPVDAVQKNLAKMLAPELVDNYYKGLLSGQISISEIANPNTSMIGRVAMDLWTQGATGLIPAYADALMTKLLLAVGTNPAYPLVVTPTAGSPIVTVNGFQTISGLLTPDTAVWTVLTNMKDKAKVQGRPVLIGGDKWKEWHRLRGIVAVNSTAGVDIPSVYNSLQHEFYYDERADAIFGTDVAIWIEPNAIAEQNFTYAKSGYLANNTKHNDLTYQEMSATITQYQPEQAGFNSLDPVVSALFDLRLKESNSSSDFPLTEFVPSIAGGLWTRPTGYFTTDSANVFKTYTGVCAVKIL